MSWKKFEDDCPACRPVLIDAETRQPLSPDSPEMQAVASVWTQTTHVEREAFHRVTCLNSRTSEDLRSVHELSVRMQEAIDGGAKS